VLSSEVDRRYHYSDRDQAAENGAQNHTDVAVLRFVTWNDRGTQKYRDRDGGGYLVVKNGCFVLLAMHLFWLHVFTLFGAVLI
jgi:hypothetical protein